MPIKRTGARKFVGTFKDRLNEMKVGTKKGMEDAVKVVAAEAARLTPVDTGDLLGSQFTEVVIKGDKIIGWVGYDKEGNHSYGAYQHEVPYDHSNSNNPQAEDKFLEKGFTNTRYKAIDAVVKAATKTWK